MAYAMSSLRVGNRVIDYGYFGTGESKYVILPGLSLTSVVEKGMAVEGLYRDYLDKFTFYLFDVRRDIEGEISIRDMADDISGAFDVLGIESAAVFGASQGGMIGQQLAIWYPEKVGSLVLASTVSDMSEKSRNSLLAWRSLAEEGNIAAFNRSFVKLVYSEEMLIRYADAFKAIETIGTQEQLEKAIRQIDAILSYDAYGDLVRIKCPVLVMGSKDDKSLDYGSMVRMADRLGCERYFYEGYGHAVYDEASDFVSRVMSFVLGSMD